MQTVRLANVIPVSTDPYVTILGKISEDKHLTVVRKSETIYSQGGRADAIYFVQTGRVKVSVVSPAGKEAVLALLGPDDYFGAECLVGQSFRRSTASTLESSTLFKVEKRVMFRALRAEPDLSTRFIASLLTRNAVLEEDLCDQLFNHSEKRLARVLLKLAHMGECGGAPDSAIPPMTHEILAEVVGTTRARITHFMNKFRRMGLIDYDGHEIVITERLMNVL